MSGADPERPATGPATAPAPGPAPRAARADARFDLSGRTALVTGASRGIGRTIARGLADAGADIVGVARTEAALAPLADEVRAAGTTFTALAADVADTAAVAALFDALAARRIVADVLVNNAGIEEVRPSLDVDEALWDRILDTNLKGAFFVAQRFARALDAAVRDGRRAAGAASILNLGSLTSAIGVPAATPYTASKSGLLGMTRALASEWAPCGIRVNAIGPGYFRTDLTEAFYADERWRRAMLARIPMARFGELDDLVGTAVFLASGASAYLTGQILYVDGGYLGSI